MKVLFVFNHPAPYKVHVYNELSKSSDIHVIFEREKAKDRPDAFYDDNEYNFPVTFLKGGEFSKENTCTNKLRKYIKAHHQEYDAIVMNGYSTVAEMKAIKYMIKNHIPYILQINGGIIKKDSPIKRKMKKYYISHASRYFSPCLGADKYLLFYGADKNKIEHYPYSNYFEKEVLNKPLTKVEKNEIRDKLNLPKNQLFVNASQFIERKNNMQLISIFKDLDYSLLLIGAGKDKNKYEKYINENSINNVRIMDFQNKKDLFEILRSADCFITLSHQDIFGHTTLEAMANGLPVISSNQVISSIDLIKNNKNGFLVDLNDEDSIKEAINKSLYLKSEESLLTAKDYTIEKTAARLKELLEK